MSILALNDYIGARRKLAQKNRAGKRGEILGWYADEKWQLGKKSSVRRTSHRRIPVPDRDRHCGAL